MPPLQLADKSSAIEIIEAMNSLLRLGYGCRRIRRKPWMN